MHNWFVINHENCWHVTHSSWSCYILIDNTLAMCRHSGNIHSNIFKLGTSLWLKKYGLKYAPAFFSVSGRRRDNLAAAFVAKALTEDASVFGVSRNSANDTDAEESGEVQNVQLFRSTRGQTLAFVQSDRVFGFTWYTLLVHEVCGGNSWAYMPYFKLHCAAEYKFCPIVYSVNINRENILSTFLNTYFDVLRMPDEITETAWPIIHCFSTMDLVRKRIIY